MMDYYRIALVVRAHGVRGAVKLLPLTDSTARFQGMKEAYIEAGGQYRAVRIASSSIQPDAVFLSLEGVDSREEAEKLRGAYIAVDRAHAVKLPPGRYFIADLIGCAVSDTKGVEYGAITDVLETGANDVYVVKGKKSMLLPALKKVLLEVDVKGRRMLIDGDIVEEVAVFED